MSLALFRGALLGCSMLSWAGAQNLQNTSAALINCTGDKGVCLEQLRGCYDLSALNREALKNCTDDKAVCKAQLRSCEALKRCCDSKEAELESCTSTASDFRYELEHCRDTFNTFFYVSAGVFIYGLIVSTYCCMLKSQNANLESRLSTEQNSDNEDTAGPAEQCKLLVEITSSMYAVVARAT